MRCVPKRGLCAWQVLPVRDKTAQSIVSWLGKSLLLLIAALHVRAVLEGSARTGAGQANLISQIYPEASLLPSSEMQQQTRCNYHSNVYIEQDHFDAERTYYFQPMPLPLHGQLLYYSNSNADCEQGKSPKNLLITFSSLNRPERSEAKSA